MGFRDAYSSQSSSVCYGSLGIQRTERDCSITTKEAVNNLKVSIGILTWQQMAANANMKCVPCSVARGRDVDDLRSHSFSTGFLSSPDEVTRCSPWSGFHATSLTQPPWGSLSSHLTAMSGVSDVEDVEG